MSDRYVAKVAKIIDEYSIAVNRGCAGGMKVGDKFIIIGIGEVLRDPDTDEELEALEIVKGRVEAVHVQEKISTLRSCQHSRLPEKKEVRKVISKTGMIALLGPQETVTESITPGESFLVKLENVKVGDSLVKA